MKFYKGFLKKHNIGKGEDFWGFLSMVTGGVCLVFAISAIVGNLIQWWIMDEGLGDKVGTSTVLRRFLVYYINENIMRFR